jgi:hypothetical protein
MKLYFKLITHLISFLLLYIPIKYMNLNNTNFINIIYKLVGLFWIGIYGYEIKNIRKLMQFHHIIASIAIFFGLVISPYKGNITILYYSIYHFSDIFYYLYRIKMTLFYKILFASSFFIRVFFLKIYTYPLCELFPSLSLIFKGLYILQVYWLFEIIGNIYMLINKRFLPQPILKMCPSYNYLFTRPNKNKLLKNYELCTKVRVLWYNFLKSQENKLENKTILYTSLQHKQMVTIAEELGFLTEFIKTTPNWQIDLNDLKMKIKKCTPSIILITHMFSKIDIDIMTEIRKIIKTNPNTILVEDCAQVPFCYYDDDEVKKSDLLMFSFGTLKQLSTGIYGGLGIFNNSTLQKEFIKQYKKKEKKSLQFEINSFLKHQIIVLIYNYFFWLLKSIGISEEYLYNKLRTKTHNICLEKYDYQPNILSIYIMKILICKRIEPYITKKSKTVIIEYNKTNLYYNNEKNYMTYYLYPYIKLYNTRKLNIPISKNISAESIITLEKDKKNEFDNIKYINIYSK